MTEFTGNTFRTFVSVFRTFRYVSIEYYRKDGSNKSGAAETNKLERRNTAATQNTRLRTLVWNFRREIRRIR